MQRPVVFSFGGGVQSVAICCLIAQGKLERPERFVIADTGREASSTWEYMEKWIKPLFDIEVAPHSLAARGDIFDRTNKLRMGGFTRDGGRLQGFCSTDWKKDVVRKYLRLQGYGKDNPIRLWLGISTDELNRARTSDVRWIENWWPLIMDFPTTRVGCLAIIENFGLPEPERSSCWMCPNRSDRQWQRLKETHPEDFEKAVAVEQEIQAVKGFDDCYLHRSCNPLQSVEFRHNIGQVEMDWECGAGEACWR